MIRTKTSRVWLSLTLMENVPVDVVAPVARTLVPDTTSTSANRTFTSGVLPVNPVWFHSRSRYFTVPDATQVAATDGRAEAAASRHTIAAATAVRNVRAPRTPCAPRAPRRPRARERSSDRVRASPPLELRARGTRSGHRG